jgi:hypothetical protein
MRLAGFNFNKISVERFISNKEGIKISTNIDISEIKEVKTELFQTKEELLGVKFKYNVDYNPEVAKLELVGDIVLAVDAELSKNVLEQWKEKKMPDNFKIALFNLILKKSTLKAIQLEDEMNLPLHIPLPSLKSEQQPEEVSKDYTSSKTPSTSDSSEPNKE